MDYISETKKLARKWVYKLEWDLNLDDLLCPEAWDSILTEDNKNPLYWSDRECEEFLYCLMWGDDRVVTDAGIVIGDKKVMPITA